MKKINEKKFSRYFKAFGDPTRMRILIILSGGELTVNDVVGKIGLAQPTISRHLAILRDANIVIDRREGQKVYYKLNKEAVIGCCDGFCNCLKVKTIKKKRK